MPKAPSLKVEYLPVEQLDVWERNPRRIDKTRFEQLKRSLANDPQMMEARPLIALTDGRVIAGNMRLHAARELGWKTVPTVVVDIDEQTAATWALRDNSAYGEWVDDELAEMLHELAEHNIDLALTGLSSEHVDRLIGDAAGPPAPTEFADPGTEASLTCPKCGYEWNQ